VGSDPARGNGCGSALLEFFPAAVGAFEDLAAEDSLRLLAGTGPGAGGRN